MSLQSLKNTVLLNAKNLFGWQTKRKIVVFAVDDYGNVRLNSKAARRKLDSKGYKAQNRFDSLDTLETRQDLVMLYDTLRSVKDRNGNHAVFTPFALPCNIDFEKVAETGFREFHIEKLPITYQKLSEQQPEAYEGTWDLWGKGLEEGLMAPQFHGREHLNLKVFEDMLKKSDEEFLANLEQRSYTGLMKSTNDPTSTLAAFDFWEFRENERFHEIISDGIRCFKNVYGYRPIHFTPSSYKCHPVLHKTLKNNGIEFIDKALISREHQGRGEFKRRFNYTGKVREGLTVLVRNVVFEPTDERGIDWMNSTMKQIEAAFRWNRPGIISSHRVNFCGHIDPKNREKGLSALQELLKRITQKWPDVEFMAANELGDLVSGRSKI